jgi:hypothetical protein
VTRARRFEAVSDFTLHLFSLHHLFVVKSLIPQGRQSFTDKAAAAAKPDSEKSYVEQATDYVKGTVDS